MNWETILFIGDSITNGARSYLSFPELCGDILEQKTQKIWNIINFSENGITANGLNKRISENWASLKQTDASLVVLLIGTNDSKSNTEEKDFGIAYHQLIIKAKLLAQNKTVLLLKIPELQKGIMFPYDISMNQSIANYNKCIEQLAAADKCDILSITCNENDFYDGVHLNKDGALNFAQQISKFILNKRGI